MVVDSDLNAVKLYDGAAWRTWNSDSVVGFENRWGASFDGTNDYMDFGTNTTINSSSAFSVSAWFDVDNIAGYPSICLLKTNLTNGFLIGLANTTGGNAIYNGVWFGSAPTGDTTQFKGFATANSTLSATLASGWHHLVLTYDGVNPQASSSTTVYIDGTAYAATQAVGLGNYGTGNYVGKGAYQYEGLIDEFAIFDSELSQADITKIYNGTAPNGKPTDLTLAASYDTANQEQNLAGYWRMGDDSNDSPTSGGAISTITDSSGNGNDAVQVTASLQPTFSDLTGETIYA
jgi:hypothetical protein